MTESKALNQVWVDKKNKTITFTEMPGCAVKTFEHRGNLMEFVLVLAEQGFRVM